MTNKLPDIPPAWVKEIHARFDHLQREIEKLRAEPFIKVEIFMSKTFNLNISDSQIANLAIDAQQTIGRIDQKVGSLQKDPGGKDLADALAKLTEVISASSEIASDIQRTELLDGVEELLAQAERPPATRKRGVIKAIVDSTANICAGAGGLATAWQVAGPTIRTFFGF